MLIKDIGNGYKVTNTGVIIGKRGKALKPYKGNHGYLSVHLYTENGREPWLVHRLVAMHFCEGYKEGLQVNHKDADRHNNNADNLEWVTLLENLEEARERNGDNTHIARARLAEVSKKAIKQLDLEGNLIKEYKSPTDLCKELGWAEYRRGKISEVAHGKRPQAFGFRFEWSDPKQASRSCSK